MRPPFACSRPWVLAFALAFSASCGGVAQRQDGAVDGASAGNAGAGGTGGDSGQGAGGSSGSAGSASAGTTGGTGGGATAGTGGGGGTTTAGTGGAVTVGMGGSAGSGGTSGAAGAGGSTGLGGRGGAVAGTGGSGGMAPGGRGGAAAGMGGTAGTSGAGGSAGAAGCASVHPNVSGSQRTCNPDRCYCAMDDGCYLTQTAMACCGGAVVCTGQGGSGGAGTGGGGRGGTAGSAGSGGRGGTSGATGAGGTGVSATDDFERGTLGPNWTIAYPTSGNQVQIIGNSDLGMVPGPQGFFLVNWTGSAFSADQWSEVVIPTDAAPGWAYQPYVRWRASDRARYGFGLDNDPNQAEYNKWYFKFDGVAGSETRMFGLVDNTTGRQPGPGDTLRVEIRGYTLYGYWNGQLMTTAMDTAGNRIADGVPGMAARVAGGNQAITQPAKVWESWAGGSL